jgi:transcriptional regulator with PAS, ATPase and Fis domain
MVAGTDARVLITGESGTGKEVFARAIHRGSPRRNKPFVAINCSAMAEDLLESELFGHEKGSFTGATRTHRGLFMAADGGTLMLDEIGDMPMRLQVKLLRVLQENVIRPVGTTEAVPVNVRVISATHRDLQQLMASGAFREDLYYRLNVVPILVPPLRERASDVGFLVLHFIEKICREEEIAVKQISRETLDRLSAHDWPGNVRQLENAVEKAIELSGERPALFPGDFPLPPRKHPMPFAGSADTFIAVPDQGLDFEKTVGGIERNILEQALKKTRGNKKLAAEMLGLKRTTLTAKLKSLAAVSAAG